MLSPVTDDNTWILLGTIGAVTVAALMHWITGSTLAWWCATGAIAAVLTAQWARSRYRSPDDGSDL